MTTATKHARWTTQYGELGTDPAPIEPYISPAYFELERERIFRRVWLNVGRVEDIPQPGDYFVQDLAVGQYLNSCCSRTGRSGARFPQRVQTSGE